LTGSVPVRAAGAVAAVAAACLVMVGCSSGPDDGLLDLESDDGTAVAEEPDPTPDVADDPDPADEEQLYPPLPELEPDPAADVSVDDQEFFLELYARLYERTLEANTTLEVAGLDETLAGEALEQQLASIEQMRRGGLYLDSRDIETRWVRVVEVENGPAVVQECRVFGASSGIRASDDNQLVEERPAPLARLLQARFALVELEGGAIEYRATELVGADEAEECSL
jgi:hypothetical protein